MANWGRVAGLRAVAWGTFPESRGRVAATRAVVWAQWPLSDPAPTADLSPATLKGAAIFSVKAYLDPGIPGVTSDVHALVGDLDLSLEDCNRVWNRERTGLAASGTDTYDLRGGLIDVYSVPIQIAYLRYAVLVNNGETSLSIGPTASAGLTGMMDGTSPRITVPPGGFYIWGDRQLLDISGGADTLSVTNLSASDEGSYEIMFIGAKP